MKQFVMLRCNDVSYRQGFVEVAARIHSRHVNIEIWNVHPDHDISNLARVEQVNSDESIVGNTEIELSILQAQSLIEALQQAIQLADRDEA